ncbi:MAG TPA: hypothetical protein PK760_02800 [Flavobacteriales bacterium]|nr:hypothetical protein [Flavobacteriales bacterium]
MRHINKETCSSLIRVGVCKHTQRRILQEFDGCSEDAEDEEGWFCLHDETAAEEQQAILFYLYGMDLMVCEN